MEGYGLAADMAEALMEPGLCRHRAGAYSPGALRHHRPVRRLRDSEPTQDMFPRHVQKLNAPLRLRPIVWGGGLFNVVMVLLAAEYAHARGLE